MNKCHCPECGHRFPVEIEACPSCGSLRQGDGAAERVVLAVLAVAAVVAIPLLAWLG